MQALEFSVSIPQWIALKAIGIASRKPFYTGPLATVKLVDRPEPPLPTPEWVTVETLMCGFCASDMSLIFLEESPTASPFTSFPSVIGHEICGRIVATGSKVNRVKPGDVVTISPALNCAAREIDPPCPACQKGLIANCEKYAAGNLAPGMIIGLCSGTAGGFAPRFVAHQSQAYRLPEAFSPQKGVLIEPLTVGLQAVYGNMPQSDENIMIVGGGVIGSMVLKSIRALGIDCTITVVDPSVFAADQAKQAGADHVIAFENVLEDTVQLTGAGRYKPMMGPDILMGGFARIFDSVGSPATLNMAMRCLAAGGTLSQVGIWHDVKLDLTPLWLKQQTLKGVYGCGFADYNGKRRHMFEIAIDMVVQGAVSLDGMVTHTFSLENYAEMIEVNLAKETHHAIKTAVSFVEN
jgi:threonine dehydrogenase-like Zn-dependent dehydrogenase